MSGAVSHGLIVRLRPVLIGNHTLGLMKFSHRLFNDLVERTVTTHETFRI